MMQHRTNRLICTVLTIVLLSLCFNMNVFSDNTVSLSFTRPTFDTVLDVGGDAILEVTAAPAATVTGGIALYDGEELVDTLPYSSAGTYTFTFENMSVGAYKYRAVVLDTLGDPTDAEAVRNVTVLNLVKREVSNETFDNVDADGNPYSLLIENPKTGSDSVGAGKVITTGFNYDITPGNLNLVMTTDKENADPKKRAPAGAGGGDSGEALYFNRLGTSTASNIGIVAYKGPGMGVEATGRIAAGRKVVMEMDAYFGSNNHLVVPLAFRKGWTTGTNQLTFAAFNRAGYFATSGTDPSKPANTDMEYVKYEANQWYHVTMEVDMASRFFDAYIDGVKVIKQRNFDPGVDYSYDTGVAQHCIISTLQFQSGIETACYFDNMKMYVYDVPPVANQLTFFKGQTTLQTGTSNIPVAADTINIRFNAGINPATITEKVQLFMVENGREYPVSFTENSGYVAPAPDTPYVPVYTQQYQMILKSSLRKNMTYKVKIGAGVVNNEGVSAPEEQTLTFTTEKPSIYVDKVAFSEAALADMGTTGTATVNFVNNTSTDKPLKAVMVLIKDGITQSIVYHNVTATVGKAAVNVPITLPPDVSGGKLFVYVWSDLTDFNPYYTSASLE